MFLRIIILGVVFGVFGTVIESIGRSWERKRLAYFGGDFFFGFPFKPMYAFGGLILYWLVREMVGFPWYLVVAIATIVITAWEYLGGFLCVKLLEERLWDYTEKGHHLHGHISFWSSKWWLVLITFYYFFVFDLLVKFDWYLEQRITISDSADRMLMTVVVFGSLILTWAMKTIRKSIKRSGRKR